MHLNSRLYVRGRWHLLRQLWIYISHKYTLLLAILYSQLCVSNN